MSVAIFRITNPVIFALTFLLSGCVYHDYPAPRIEGILMNRDEPLIGVTVSLAEFDQQIASVQTDSNGHFTIEPQGNWHIFIPVGPQDRLSSWTLTTINRQGTKLNIYTSHRLGGIFSGYSGNDRLKLFCELSPVDRKSRSLESGQLCESIPVNQS